MKVKLTIPTEIVTKEISNKIKEMDMACIGIKKITNIIKEIGVKISEMANLSKERLISAKLFQVYFQMDKEKGNLIMLMSKIIRAGLKIGKMA